jgi:hypothetical protein
MSVELIQNIFERIAYLWHRLSMMHRICLQECTMVCCSCSKFASEALALLLHTDLVHVCISLLDVVLYHEVFTIPSVRFDRAAIG